MRIFCPWEVRYTAVFAYSRTMLRPSSTFRCIVAYLLMSFLLVAEVAMASYVCPQQDTPAEVVQMVVDGVPCTTMDDAQPVQCAKFQSGEELALEYLAAPFALTPGAVRLIHPVSITDLSAVSLPEWTDPVPSIGMDPPYLRTQRIRI